MLRLMEIVGMLWLSASVGWVWVVRGSLACVVNPAQTGLGGWKRKGKEKRSGKRSGVGQQEPPDVEKCGEMILGKVKLRGLKGWRGITP